MTLENQVCSLPFAQRVKELGVKQDFVQTPFWWVKVQGEYQLHYHNNWPWDGKKDDPVAAFTVAELGEMLPAEMSDEHGNDNYSLTTVHAYDFWCVYYSNFEGRLGEQMEADTEADARAKMLIYLLENGLIKA